MSTNARVIRGKADHFVAKIKKNEIPKDTLPNISQAFDFKNALVRFKETVEHNKKSLLTSNY